MFVVFNYNVLKLHELDYIIGTTERGMNMTTNLNIRTDKEVKEKSDKIFNELGLTMTSAINMFLRATIRENGIPFKLTLDVPNDTTREAIIEGRKIATSKNARGYTSMKELKEALEK